MEKTVKCPICEKPYKIFSNIKTDQTACPSCRKMAVENMVKSNSNKEMFKTGARMNDNSNLVKNNYGK